MSELLQDGETFKVENFRKLNLNAKNGNYYCLVPLTISGEKVNILLKERIKIRKHRFAYFKHNAVWYRIAYGEAKRIKEYVDAKLVPGKSGRPKKVN